jgi:hypothetical protein
MDVSMGSPTSPIIPRSEPREFDRAEGARESAFDLFFVESEPGRTSVEEPVSEPADASADVDEPSAAGEDAITDDSAGANSDPSPDASSGEAEDEPADEDAGEGATPADDDVDASSVGGADAANQVPAVVPPIAVPGPAPASGGGAEGAITPTPNHAGSAGATDPKLALDAAAAGSVGSIASTVASLSADTTDPQGEAAAASTTPVAAPVPSIEGVTAPASVAEVTLASAVTPNGATAAPFAAEPAVPVAAPTTANAAAQDIIEMPTRMARLSTDVPEVIVRSLRNGANEARLTVYPPDLGSVRLRLVELEGRCRRGWIGRVVRRGRRRGRTSQSL